MTAIDKLEMSQTNTFDTMNLIGLRKYACCTADKKKNEWYLECVGCEKKTCAVGRRVNDILEDGTKPVKSQVQKFEEKAAKHKMAERVKLLEEALKHDDPYMYMVEQGYYKNRGSAFATIKEWTLKNAPELHKRFLEANLRRVKENGKKTGALISACTKDRIARIFDGVAKKDRLRAALEGSHGDFKIHSVTGRLYTWAKSYPDLNEKYGLSDLASEMSKTESKYGNQHTVSEVLSMMNEEEGPMVTVNCAEPEKKDDEMSLEEFLNEVPEIKRPEKAAAEPMLKAETKGPEKAAADDPMEVLRNQFGQKKTDLLAKKQMLLDTIRKAQDTLKDLDAQIKTLDDAALIFGMVPKTGKEAEK